jgi:hypothetical protein
MAVNKRSGHLGLLLEPVPTTYPMPWPLNWAYKLAL